MRRSAKLDLTTHNWWDLNSDKLFHVGHNESYSEVEMMLASPHQIQGYMLRWVRECTGVITIDHVPYQLQPNMFFIGNPDQIRWFDLDQSSSFSSSFINFRPEIFALMSIQGGVEGIISKLGNPPIIQLDTSQIRFVEAIFTGLLHLPDQSGQQINKLVASMIQSLLLFLSSTITDNSVSLTKNQQNYLNIYRQFLDQLNLHYKKFHFTSDYVDLLYIPIKRLNRACKSITGKTAGDIIADRLDFEAKRLMYYSTFTVKEISYELGFRDPTYFIKFFKSRNGLAPKRIPKQTTKAHIIVY